MKVNFFKLVVQSPDGGLTWFNSGADQMGQYTVSRIVIDPVNPRNVLAATGRGGSQPPAGQIFRSSDGGVHWTNVVDNAGHLLPDANWDDLQRCEEGPTFWASASRQTR